MLILLMNQLMKIPSYLVSEVSKAGSLFVYIITLVSILKYIFNVTREVFSLKLGIGRTLDPCANVTSLSNPYL